MDAYGFPLHEETVGLPLLQGFWLNFKDVRVFNEVKLSAVDRSVHLHPLPT